MAGELKHLRSSTTDKRPTASGLGDGRIAINTASGSPGLFFKDNADNIVKVGPVFVGSGAPNASPAVSGSSGNSIGEQWLDTSDGNYVFKIWDGSAWRSEAGEFVNASGDTMTGDLVMNNADLVFEGSTEDGFETVLTVVNPTADNVITLPDITGTVVTTGDNGTVTSGMILDGTIGNAEINANAEIAVSKLASGASNQLLQTNSAGNAVEFTNDVDVPGTLDVTGDTTLDSALDVIGNITASGTIDVSGLLSTNGGVSFSSGTPSSPSLYPGTDSDTGIFSSSVNTIGVATSGTTRLFINDDGKVGIGTSSPGARLEVSEAGATDGILLSLDNVTNAAGTEAGLSIFQNSTDQLRCNLLTDRQGLNAGVDFKVELSNSTGTVTERFRITEGGNVGIGTNSPGFPLVVSGENSTVCRLSNTANSSAFLSLAGINSTQAPGVGCSNNDLVFNTAFTERFRIDSDGNVGIGTSSPVGKTNVVYSGTIPSLTYDTAEGINLDAGGVQVAFGIDSGSPFGGFIQARDNGNGARTLNLNPVGGNVGIGTRTPDELLHIEGDTAEFKGTNTNPIADTAGTEQVFKFGIEGQKNNLYGPAGSIIFRQDDTTWSSVSANQKPTRIEFCTQDGTTSDTSESPRMVIDQDGNVGIGTNNPGNRLTIRSTASDQLRIEGNAGDGINVVRDTTTGFLDFDGTQETFSGFSFSTTPSGGSLTERYTITNPGRHRYFSSDATVAELSTSSSAGTTNFLVNGKFGATGIGGGSNCLLIYSNGNIQNSNNSYGAISDVKLKENIVDANSQWDDLKALQIRNYNFKEGQTHTQIGVVAQEVELVSPGLVTESPDRDDEGNDLGTVTKSVNYSVLYMKAVKALQEAMERIEALEQRLSDAGL